MMATDILKSNGDIEIKKLKLDKNYLFNNDEIEIIKQSNLIKYEPNNSCDSFSTDERSRSNEIKQKLLNSTTDSKNFQKSAEYFVSSFNHLSSEEDFIQLNVNDISNLTKCYENNFSQIRPSEALFVRCLLPHCKRLAPLWFKGVSSMREKNREDHKRISSSNVCHNQNDWEKISNLINNMNQSSETETVVNLLKKLYKELPSETVMWFIKCWLKFPDTVTNAEKCVLSRGDARGRMRRIDGGKGSDKVWRLDTIVGMMFHGMPMSSTDTNIMVHTCDNELCIRPQHLRFRASSVAFVAVLKALQQTGYSIIPPSGDMHSVTEGGTNLCDEFVDISGPFKIDQLLQYRLEELRPYEQVMGKLNSSSTDSTLLEKYPVLKNYYPVYGSDFHRDMHNCEFRKNIFGTTGHIVNKLKRPAKSASNSTGSPPQYIDGISRQCHSPPHLSSVKSSTTEIAPTPRKLEFPQSNHIDHLKYSTESQSSSSMFSNDRDRKLFNHVSELIAEQPCDSRRAVSMDSISTTSRITNESPLISVSNNGSGKNTPRQPAKKRLEARTPTFLDECLPDSFSEACSPSDNKLCNPNNTMSAFRIVPKKNVTPDDLKHCDEDELEKIFDPCKSFQNSDYNPNSQFRKIIADIDGNVISKDSIPELDLSHYKPNESLTTPSPLDYLVMALSQQNQNLSVSNDQTRFTGGGSCSPSLDCHKPSLFSPSSSKNNYRIPLKTSSSISCRFTPEQASVLFNVICNSPYGNNNPEIVDILFNMMQQYPCIGDNFHGDLCQRSDSCVLRRQIYQQLSKISPLQENYPHTPLLNEISNNENSVLSGTSPLQNSFNRPSSATRNNRIYTHDE